MPDGSMLDAVIDNGAQYLIGEYEYVRFKSALYPFRRYCPSGSGHPGV